MAHLTDLATRTRRFSLRHRRSLAAAFTALAVLFTLHALTADTATTPVLVAGEPIPAGTALDASMLIVRHYPSHLAPDDALAAPDEAAGRPVGAAVGPGEPVTQNRLLTTRPSGEPGSVLTPVRIDDPAQVAGVEPGDRVTVVAADPLDGDIEVLARDATVEAVTTPAEAGLQTMVLHIAVDEATALEIAGASGRAPLTVMVQSASPSP